MPSSKEAKTFGDTYGFALAFSLTFGVPLTWGGIVGFLESADAIVVWPLLGFGTIFLVLAGFSIYRLCTGKSSEAQQ